MTVEELREKWVLDAPYIWGEGWPELKSDIEAMIASEREACAQIAESHPHFVDVGHETGAMERTDVAEIVAGIRARGEKSS